MATITATNEVPKMTGDYVEQFDEIWTEANKNLTREEMCTFQASIIGWMEIKPDIFTSKDIQRFRKTLDECLHQHKRDAKQGAS